MKIKENQDSKFRVYAYNFFDLRKENIYPGKGYEALANLCVELEDQETGSTYNITFYGVSTFTEILNYTSTYDEPKGINWTDWDEGNTYLTDEYRELSERDIEIETLSGEDLPNDSLTEKEIREIFRQVPNINTNIKGNFYKNYKKEEKNLKTTPTSFRRWKESNLLTLTEQSESNTYDIDAFTEELKESLEDILEDITSKYIDFNEEYRERFGTASADSNNPKFPMHGLSKILFSIEKMYKNNPNWDDQAWDSLHDEIYRGDNNYYSPSYNDNWEEAFEELFTSLSVDMNTIHEYEEKIKAAQEAASRDLPVLKKYRRALKALREAKKSITKSITILEDPGKLFDFNALA